MTNYIASIDLGGTHLRTAFFSEQGRVVAQSKIKTESAKGVSAVLQRMRDAVVDLAQNNSIAIDDIGALGIGVPGPVNSVNGLVHECPNMVGWHNIPKIIQKHTCVDF